VGIIIPNPGQWLLPEFQDIGRTLQTTLQLPPDATIGHGFTLQPTSDGLLISMPSGGARLPAACPRPTHSFQFNCIQTRILFRFNVLLPVATAAEKEMK